jgi:beta-galactosidase
LVDRWEGPVEAQYHPYVVPQEHGAHIDARWFSLTGPDGSGLRVTGVPRIHFAARRHGDAALFRARTLADLDPDPAIEVHVDTAVRGLGTGACGPDTLPRYRVDGGLHRWSWLLAVTPPTPPPVPAASESPA